MADTLSDLTRLSQFAGTNVPAAPLNGPCLSLFGQLMTHPTRVTYPWPPLRTTLSSFFNTVNPTQGLDLSRIQSGWCGLALVATSFRRLELVQSEADKQQVHEWLEAVKQAAIIKSLTFRDATSNELYEVINSFKSPISPEDLEQYEAIAAREAAAIMAHHGMPAWNVPNGQISGHGAHDASSPAIKKPQQQQSGFDDDAIDPLDLSESDEGAVEDDGDDYVEKTGRKRKRASSSAGARKETTSAAERRSSSVQAVGEVGQVVTAGPSSGVYASQNSMERPIVTQLAKRINEMTGIALNKCIESLSRFSDDDLGSINPNLPIPPQFLPGGQGPPQPRGVAMASSSKPKPTSRARSATSVDPEGNGNAIAGPSGTPLSGAGASGGGSGAKKASKASKPHDPNRPSFSYSALIGQAILGNPDKRARLSEIYDFVMTNYPYYRRNESGWQNSIRHNLSLQPVFRKIPDETYTGNKKSCFWTIKEEEEWRFAGGGWQKMGVGSGNHRRKGGSASASPAPGGSKRSKRKTGADDDDDDFGDVSMASATPAGLSDED
ncbi:hypothetical protein OIV83_005503 [Microbotryomycetes sp. JL201]|nr:hypothetical protein OIV83_005503 [Microbotryomycetes sp. JL201]